MRPFIIAVVMLVIAATAGTIYIGSTTFDGIVVDRPYEAGLAWDETHKQQARIGWKVFVDRENFRPGVTEIALRIVDRSGLPLDSASVVVTLSRPATNEYDRTFRAVPVGSGRYRAQVTVPLPGLWDVRTTASRGRDSFTAVARLEAAGRSH